MKMRNGILKILHSVPCPAGASPEEKRAAVRRRLEEIRASGYDGIVTNAEWTGDYLKTAENLRTVVEKAEICRELGLRMWIYDEKGYPSGAAGTATLERFPDAEAKALAAVYRVLAPGEKTGIPLPHGHLSPVAAFGYRFAGETLTDADLDRAPVRAVFSDGAFRFENGTAEKLFCLAFFTKPAFEGTHCQHSAYAIRRYADIADPRVGAAFVDNTYRVYADALDEFLRDGTVEAFFMDEPSYMGVYFNLQKDCGNVVHAPDPDLPLWAIVNWTDRLPERFLERYGYRIEDRLPALFLGDRECDRAVRKDFYLLLTSLAEGSFFAPVSEFCESRGVACSGHVLLEECLTDHPLYEGNYFSYLKRMHVPGMDMLDSAPERIRAKAFTPLIVSSVARLHRDGVVFDEVSAHFQNKFGVPVTPLHVFNSLLMQFALGAGVFASYYDDSLLVSQKTPTGESVLSAVKRVMGQITQETPPTAAIFYPIEAVMSETVSPVDVARVYNSNKNHEYHLSYPLNRAEIGSPVSPVRLVDDSAAPAAEAIEKSVENCMSLLLDAQISLCFSDAASIPALIRKRPDVFVIPAHAPTAELLERIESLAASGCLVVAVTDGGRFTGLYRDVEEYMTFVDDLPALRRLLDERGLIRTSGDTQNVVALRDTGKILLVNGENRAKSIRLLQPARSLTDCFSRSPIPFARSADSASFTLPPYGVCLAEVE